MAACGDSPDAGVNAGTVPGNGTGVVEDNDTPFGDNSGTGTDDQPGTGTEDGPGIGSDTGTDNQPGSGGGTHPGGSIGGDPCAPNPCQNAGNCVPNGDAVICECEDNYAGPLCELPALVEGSGDTCESPFVINASLLPTSVSHDNGAVDGAGNPLFANDYVFCNGSNGAGEPDVVYAFMPEISGTYPLAITSYDGESASLLSVVSDCANLYADPEIVNECLASKDFFSSVEPVLVDMVAYTTYFLVVDSYNEGEIGPFTLEIGAPCLDTCEPGTCGDNGCGGTCACVDGDSCVDGLCCVPDCGVKACGSDGCGGLCGTCETGFACDSVVGVCADQSGVVGNSCELPHIIEPSALPWLASDDNTNYANNYVSCSGYSGSEQPDVVYSFTAPQTGIYFVGMPGYEMSAGASLVGVTTDCATVTADLETANECIWSTDFYGSGGSESPVEMNAGETYFLVVDSYSDSEIGPYSLSLSEPCFPKCDGYGCGVDNGCGGTCGCGDGQTCNESVCCTPKCNNVTCGEAMDGCGGTCGCGDGSVCIGGTCGAPPQGDTCEDPIVITLGAGDVTVVDGDTAASFPTYGYESGMCPGEEESSWGMAANDQAYLLKATKTGLYTVLLDATYDSNLYAVLDCNDIGNTCLAAHETIGPETIEFDLTSGEAVFIIVDGWSNYSDQSGPYTLSVSFTN
jgi:hypothetical protein